MTLPWPQHWEFIPQEDREAVSEILTRLLAHGALLGDEGRERQLYLLARNDVEQELREYFAPLGLELVFDPDAPIIQLRPVDGACGLSGRFNKAETLVLLTLWRRYHDVRMEQVTHGIFLTVKELWQTLKVYFEEIQPPNETQLKQILQRLRHHRLIRMQRPNETDAFEAFSLEILPTLHRVIPFENVEAWEERRDLYRNNAETEQDEAEAGRDLS